MSNYLRVFFGVRSATTTAPRYGLKKTPYALPLFFNNSTATSVGASVGRLRYDNPIGKLKEWVDGSHSRDTQYSFFGEDGGSVFTCKVKAIGAVRDVKGAGKGSSKKEAKREYVCSASRFSRPS
jgi:hypothetical protein